MNVGKKAMAGTMESNDVLVYVSPVPQGIEVRVKSIVANQFGMSVGELNQLHSRCNYALSARFTTQEEWNVFYRESLGKLKAFCTKDMKPVYCEEAMAAHGPQ